MNDDFEDALSRMMKKLEDGTLYKEQREAMYKSGIDPDKPINLKFSDGSELENIPDDSIRHLKPETRTKKVKKHD